MKRIYAALIAFWLVFAQSGALADSPQAGFRGSETGASIDTGTDSTKYVRSDGNHGYVMDVPAGAGTVNSGTDRQVAIYDGTGDTLSGDINLVEVGGQLRIGILSTLAGTIQLFGGTSGSVVISVPAAAGSTTLAIPAANCNPVVPSSAGSNQWASGINSSGVISYAQPAFTNISGSVAAAQLPNPSASTLGGIQSYAAVTNEWIRSISTSGVPASSQPAFTNLSGALATAQLPAIASTNLWVGNGSSVATAVALSGDATMANTGAVTVTKTGGVSFAASATTDTTSASNISSGTLSISRFPALTSANFWLGNGSNAATAVTLSGDATMANTGAVTIANSAVTLAKMADLANNRVLGNVSGGAAAPAALTATQLTTLVNAFTTSLSGAAPASGGGSTNYLRADGTWAEPPGTVTGLSSTLTNAHIYVGNGSNVATDVAVSGDITLANTGAVTVTKINGSAPAASATTDALNATNISSGTLAAARLPSTAVQEDTSNTYTGTNTQDFSASTQTLVPPLKGLSGSPTTGEVAIDGADIVYRSNEGSPTNRKALRTDLTSAQFFVGNGSNVATGVAMSGDATLANTGAVTLANTAVTPGSYTAVDITVDAKGRITAAANGSGGGSGTVNTGADTHLAVYAGTGTTVDDANTNATLVAGALELGTNTTTLGTLKLYGNTSGNVKITPNAAAGTNIVCTLPATDSNTVIPDTGASNNFLTAISSGGVISKAQPSYANLSGSGSTNITTLGTITTGVWNGTDVAVADGGTGVSTITNHGVVLGQGTSAVVATAAGTAGNLLMSGGASADPSFNANSVLTNGALDLGANASVIGTLKLYGNTSGNVKITPNAVAGTNIVCTLPATDSNTVIPDAGASNNFLTAISSGGVISKAQPSYSNLSGSGSTNITTLGTITTGTWNGTDIAAAYLADTAVTPAAYTNANITVDQQGRITAAANGSAGGGLTYETKSGNFTAVADYMYTVTATATVTLPTAASVSGKKIIVINDGSSATLTFNTTSSQTISGQASGDIVSSVRYNSYTFMSDGSNWFMVGG